MTRYSGYGLWEGDTRVERDSLTCCHCHYAWFVTPGSGNQRGWCLSCMGPTCGKGACQPCVPFLKKLEQEESRQRLIRSICG
mgnify:CR=1 FL=1